MRAVHLRECEPRDIDLSDEQADAILRLGRELASRTAWWGADESSTAEERTVISCVPNRQARWRITVNNAIGAFGVGDLTFVVLPKIPIQHVLYILSRGIGVPRLNDAKTQVATGDQLWELLSRWFVDCSKRVVENELLKDYEAENATLSAIRGQLDALSSAAHYYSGSLAFECFYDEYTTDNARNRVLLSALNVLQSLAQLPATIRREASRVAGYFDGVGSLQARDIDVEIDRRSAHYRDPLALARLIISATSISLAEGSTPGWTFLIRTPETIEAGIRSILRDGLAPETRVSKYGTALVPEAMMVEPDLRFDPVGSVGDVKYKLFEGGWPRGDLYQGVAFAAAAHATEVCVISFACPGVERLSAVRFGEITACNIVWEASGSADPGVSAGRLTRDVRTWLMRTAGEEASIQLGDFAVSS